MGEPARKDVKTEVTIGYTLLGKDAPWGKYLAKATPEDRALYVRWAKLSTGLFEIGLIKVRYYTRISVKSANQMSTIFFLSFSLWL